MWLLVLSRQWDAAKPEEKSPVKTLDQLGGKNPISSSYSPLSTTKNTRFQEFLDGVWTYCPGHASNRWHAVMGFITSHGCFTRGATAIAFSYPRMDVAVGIGKNTKETKKSSRSLCEDD